MGLSIAKPKRRKTMKNIQDIKEAIGCIVFAIMMVVFGWLYCLATPNQLSGEGDWNEQMINEAEEDIGEYATPKAGKISLSQALNDEYAKGDLVFAGVNLEDSGKKVVVTLTFARK